MKRDRKYKAATGKISRLGPFGDEQSRALFLTVGLNSLFLLGLGFLYAKNLLLISP